MIKADPVKPQKTALAGTFGAGALDVEIPFPLAYKERQRVLKKFRQSGGIIFIDCRADTASLPAF